MRAHARDFTNPTQADVMRKLEITDRNNFYRTFYQVMKQNENTSRIKKV